MVHHLLILYVLDYIFSLFKNYETSNLNPIGCVAAVQSKEIFIVDKESWETKEQQLLGEINEIVEKIKLYQLDTGG